MAVPELILYSDYKVRHYKKSESAASTIGLITIDVKLAEKRSAGNLHAVFDEAGVRNGVDDPLEGDTRPKGEKRFGLTRSRTASAPVLDPTCEGGRNNSKTQSSGKASFYST